MAPAANDNETQSTDQTQQQTRARKPNFFQRIANFFKNPFKSKSESESEPDDDVGATQARANYDYDAAKIRVGTVAALLTSTYLPQLQQATAQNENVADDVVDAAQQDVGAAADEIDGQVAPHWTDCVRDIATGIGDGSQAMVRQALVRGDIGIKDIKLKKILKTGGSEALVYSGDYLGMAPIAYKKSKADYYEEGDDPISKEQKLMGKYDDPNILHGSSSETRFGDHAGYAMELAGRGDLDDLKKKMHGNDEDETDNGIAIEDRILLMRYLMKGGFSGLDQVHKDNTIHGDIKLDNFLLGDDDQAKLMDFGVAKPEISQEERSKDPMSYNKQGTAKYMAPEVAAGGTGLERKSDIWSMGESFLQGVLGMSSVELSMTGSDDPAKKPSYTSKTPEEVTRAKLGGNDTWQANLQARTEGVEGGDKFTAFIKKVMAWSPSDRPTAGVARDDDYLALTPQEQKSARALLRTLMPKTS